MLTSMAIDAPNRFFLEAIDPATGCIVYDTEVEDLPKVCGDIRGPIRGGRNVGSFSKNTIGRWQRAPT